ncbi:sugar ABC transporter substrate-binding protein [Salinisphaera sp.]|uniref:sugar ABC transporter substrate-binding protein n=1 Tax=Salinisphaera sp. TaxID=1914330 RepID=UPI002D78743B|nr:sugar ABC transporter substrate-binding protein [Salinisphaera sp.]HET7314238.1 sugar ABC transporter substrate-binding protein [Salinisphaera sp.]
MKRRDLLIQAAGGFGSAMLLGTLPSLAWAEGGKCYSPWKSGTPTFSWPKKKPPYRIALSNSYIGNAWRSEMVTIAKMYAQRPDVKPLIEDFRLSSAGNDVNAQIAQINQMILGGVDAIVLDAASPTGLNSTIERAASAGILMVSFDNVVTTDKAIAINQNQFEMGKRWADFVVEQIGGKGHVLVVRGVAGTFVDQERYKGGRSVFDQHSGIRTTEVYGNWDSGTAQKVTANAIAAGAKFDAVWSEGGDSGVVNAFKQNGLKVPPIAGEAENGFRIAAAKEGFPILSIGQSAGLVALSMKVALSVLQGEKVPQSIQAPLNPVTNDDLEKGKNYFMGIPDSFFDEVGVPDCGLDFNAAEVYHATTS